MTETLRNISDGGRIGLFVAAALAFTAAVAMLEPTGAGAPLGVVGLLAVSVLLVLFSLGRPAAGP